MNVGGTLGKNPHQLNSDRLIKHWNPVLYSVRVVGTIRSKFFSLSPVYRTIASLLRIHSMRANFNGNILKLIHFTTYWTNPIKLFSMISDCRRSRTAITKNNHWHIHHAQIPRMKWANEKYIGAVPYSAKLWSARVQVLHVQCIQLDWFHTIRMNDQPCSARQLECSQRPIQVDGPTLCVCSRALVWLYSIRAFIRLLAERACVSGGNTEEYSRIQPEQWLRPWNLSYSDHCGTLTQTHTQPSRLASVLTVHVCDIGAV